MERRVQRRRMALDELGTDDEDELDCEPNELNQRRDPVYQLEQARARASNKLKSRFEGIFAKYEKDFTGIGDEIDLRTGKVVVDNGHLQSIAGVQEFGEGVQDEQEDIHFSEGHRPVNGLGGSSPGSPWAVASLAGIQRPPAMVPPDNDGSFLPSGQPFGPWEMARSQVVDPAWQTPELPQSAFLRARFASQAQQRSFGTGQLTRRIRGSLASPRSQDGDEDVLLGVPDPVPGTKESPLIKSKFPAVGSSPNNDPALNAMIQDVIEDIAAGSPSAEQSRRRVSRTRSSPNPSVKLVTPGAKKYCTRVKSKSESYTRSTGKSLAVSPCQTDKVHPLSNKEQTPQKTILFPTHAVKSRKRRQPKTPSEQRTRDLRGKSDASAIDEEFLDITGNTPLKPAGQTFYVEIKARKIGQIDMFTRDLGGDVLDTVDRSSLGADVQERTYEPPLGGPTGVGSKSSGPPSEPHVTEPSRKRLGSGVLNPESNVEFFQRRILNPTFASTGTGELPKRGQKSLSTPTKKKGKALQVSQPNVPQRRSEDGFERNIVDPTYIFSDEENLLPRRKRDIGQNSEPASPPGLVAHGASRNYKKAEAGKAPSKAVGLDAPDQEKRDRVARTLPQAIVEHDEAKTATEPSTPSLEQNSGQAVSDHPPAIPLSSTHWRARRTWPEEPASKQLGQQAEAGPRPTKGIGKKSSLLATVPAVAKDDTTSVEPAKMAEPHSVLPSTPQPGSKSRSKKTDASISGLISLLSDDEDEEDEISFNLADFTPSRHHRILALPQDANLPATASTGKRKRVASLFFGPASTSKASRYSTPGRDGRGKRRRRSTINLAVGVAKVGRNSPRAPSPTASVVQTPGGTQRRCGENGFRCERDFCFVCISI
jgi:hypothetical protein